MVAYAEKGAYESREDKTLKEGEGTCMEVVEEVTA
jgi:hypothetical protein